MRIPGARVFAWMAFLLFFLSVWNVGVLWRTLNDLRFGERERNEIHAGARFEPAPFVESEVSGALFDLSGSTAPGSALRTFPRGGALLKATVRATPTPRAVGFLGSGTPEVVVFQEDRVWGIMGPNIVCPEWVFFDGSGGVLFSSER